MEEKNEEIVRVENPKITIIKNDIIKFLMIKNNVEKIKIKKMIKINGRIISMKKIKIKNLKTKIKRIMIKINGKIYEKRKE